MSQIILIFLNFSSYNQPQMNSFAAKCNFIWLPPIKLLGELSAAVNYIMGHSKFARCKVGHSKAVARKYLYGRMATSMNERKNPQLLMFILSYEFITQAEVSYNINWDDGNKLTLNIWLIINRITFQFQSNGVLKR